MESRLRRWSSSVSASSPPADAPIPTMKNLSLDGASPRGCAVSPEWRAASAASAGCMTPPWASSPGSWPGSLGVGAPSSGLFTPGISLLRRAGVAGRLGGLLAPPCIGACRPPRVGLTVPDCLSSVYQLLPTSAADVHARIKVTRRPPSASDAWRPGAPSPWRGAGRATAMQAAVAVLGRCSRRCSPVTNARRRLSRWDPRLRARIPPHRAPLPWRASIGGGASGPLY